MNFQESMSHRRAQLEPEIKLNIEVSAPTLNLEECIRNSLTLEGFSMS